MTGLEHGKAPVELRERLSFTRQQTAETVRDVRAFPDVSGCVLISTCNRTELYVSSAGGEEPGRLLCRAAGVEYAPFEGAFFTLSGEDASRHLMEVAAGLRSRIWGEDQIISQVRQAIAIAREAGTADALLETLFRSAVAAGKEVRTRVRLTSVPASAAGTAVELLRDVFGDLAHRRAVVIGNGEMGRLAASLLQRAGCETSVTLRTYRHGETIVPPGCGVVPYEDRMRHIDGCDILISATTSPHYTVTAEQMASLEHPPRAAVDLAIPRDIQPEVGELSGVSLYNIDDLGSVAEHRAIPPAVEEILRAQMDNFSRWMNYRDCMTSVESLKQALVNRLLTSPELAGEASPEEVVELAVGKTVDLLVSGLAGHITPDSLQHCESKIRTRTTGRRVVS